MNSLSRSQPVVSLFVAEIERLKSQIPFLGHVFTVETLDGVCFLDKYYSKDAKTGRWVGLTSPPADYQSPPVCPTCRAGITSPRYGRPHKRAALDILERCQATDMSRSMAELQTAVQAFDMKATEALLKAAALTVETPAPADNIERATPEQIEQEHNSLIAQSVVDVRNPQPADPRLFGPRMNSAHCLPASHTNAWKKLLKDLLSTYRAAVKIASTHSAHVKAYEASFAWLFRHEIKLAEEAASHAPKRPEENAMRVARLTVGQRPPRADKRFIVEAFWASIKIRFQLADLAQLWIDTVKGRPLGLDTNNADADAIRYWTAFVKFIYKSCIHDAQISIRIAKDSEALRQSAISTLLLWQAEFARAQNVVKESRRSMHLMTMDALRGVEETIRGLGRNSKRELLDAMKDCPQERGGEYMEYNFFKPAENLDKRWDKLARSIFGATFYQEVSDNDRMQVIESFDFCE
jgi:hypothetical protein